ncbi:MAG TPA: bifunctional diaminohydroxyphosphoribosylaminopyrimidine deaminase/5-amino-6-(5-phosphoribosylamino)uracil reductase RibD, partial [Flavipsychrobacter sp.]|nr:bifunctional diaminohydroxyphosphoribosylaminopyrimidine deaminase/5-amino-6-(5-phosphoribosylamino)uracil reductase RibD [Flavipsychrobacter sp.]
MKNNEAYMKRCLELALTGRGNVAPNPMVGAVLVHEGRIIGEGFHAVRGQNHAEVNCLESVREEDKHLIPESTMYVSLEPCAHFGKTPPCAVRLVKERVKEVIVGNEDPFEKVSGKGLSILREHNIETESGILQQQGLWLNRRFFCFHQRKRPYIILKWAQTEQGFFAPLNRSRFQMSNRHSQQLVHKWRTEE